MKLRDSFVVGCVKEELGTGKRGSIEGTGDRIIGGEGSEGACQPILGGLGQPCIQIS